MINNQFKLIVAVYIDDIIVFSNYKESVANFKLKLEKNFPIKDLGKANLIFGINLTHDLEKGTIS